MSKEKPNVIVIPAKPELSREAVNTHRQLRVAAYCRVSTDEKEQINSYENQKKHYTDTIMKNPAWTLAGIFADEGITGTSAKKRPEFLRMIRFCKQKKIDIILVKSISRFSRNTVDCLNYIRILKALGVAVIFEEQNINSLQEDSEFMITLHGAFAQQESESISANVRWGKRQAMKEGKAAIAYKCLYAYRKGENGEPEIIPEEAEVVREIYRMFLAGASTRMIQNSLNERGIPNLHGAAEWNSMHVRRILTNEKYCGDVLLQKTFIADCISKKSVKNTGQLPMYLVQNHHEAIVDRATFDAAQTEMARRNAKKSPSAKAPTGLGKYASKYALSERLVCGECGTLYKRCTWTRNGGKRIVWRCISRLEFGKQYCHDSPTLDEEPLQSAILAAINAEMSSHDSLVAEIIGAMEQELTRIPGESMGIHEINIRLAELEKEFGRLLPLVSERGTDGYDERFQEILAEMKTLKDKRSQLEEMLGGNAEANRKIVMAKQALAQTSAALTEWSEPLIRQLVETVRVLSAEEIEVTLRGGLTHRQKIEHK